VLPAGWLIARLTGARLLYDSHEIHAYSVSMQKRPPLWRAACRRVEAALLRRADAAITANDSYARVIARVHRVAPPVSVYNAPRLAESRGAAPISLREAARTPPGRGVVAYCGRIQRSRGIEESIEALRFAPEMELVLLGDGEPSYFDILRQLARQHGVAERVKFVDPVRPAEVSATLGTADLSLVLIQDAGLSYRLSAPNKLFESVHAGVPMVGCDLPEIRAVVARYECGLIVDQASPRSIAEGARRILGDPALRERFARGARAAAQQLNWEHEEQKLLATYRALV
jgi:glycosyltransferase involved in cell wall biosynthesis